MVKINMKLFLIIKVTIQRCGNQKDFHTKYMFHYIKYIQDYIQSICKLKNLQYNN